MTVVVCVIVRFNSVRMALLSMRVLVTVPVRVTSWSMAVSYIVEKYKTNEVRGETEGTNNENELGLRNFLGFDESLDGFEKDRETQCDKKNAVYESTKGFCTLPLYGVSTAQLR